MKRERIEDLGRIMEMMDRIEVDYEELEGQCDSKHTRELFVEVYGEVDKRYELHDKLRLLFEALSEVRYIASGDIDD